MKKARHQDYTLYDCIYKKILVKEKLQKHNADLWVSGAVSWGRSSTWKWQEEFRELKEMFYLLMWWWLYHTIHGPNFIKLYAYNGYILILQKLFLNKAAKIPTLHFTSHSPKLFCSTIYWSKCCWWKWFSGKHNELSSLPNLSWLEDFNWYNN